MIRVRRMEDRDLPFVVSGWSSSYRTSYSSGVILMADWATIMHDQIGKHLARAETTVLVAHETDDPDPIADLFGFLAVNLVQAPPLVLYVYVKEASRCSGIARALFRAAGVDPERRFHYACKTAIVSRLERKIPMARWQPLLARFDKPEQGGDRRERDRTEAPVIEVHRVRRDR